VGSISYCIQYLARLAIGQKSNTYFGNLPKNSLTLTYLRLKLRRGLVKLTMCSAVGLDERY